MWALLLLWPLALGFSLDDPQTPIIYDDDGGSTERGDGE